MSGPESMKPDDQLLEDFLGGRGTVREAYRAAAQEQPPAGLDSAILQAAQAAVQPAQRPQRAVWRRSPSAVAAAAVVVLSFGVFLQLQRDPAVQQVVMAPPASVGAALDAASFAAPAAPEQAQEPEQSQAAVEQRAEPPQPKREVLPPEKKRLLIPRPSISSPAPPPPASSMLADAPAPITPAAAALMDMAPAVPANEAGSSSASRVSPGASPPQAMAREERAAAAAAPRAKLSRSADHAAAFAAEADTVRRTQPATCPELVGGESPVIASAAAAVAAARPMLIEQFGADAIARSEPLQGEQRGSQWRVFGPAAGGVAEALTEITLCAATGAVLPVQPLQ